MAFLLVLSLLINPAFAAVIRLTNSAADYADPSPPDFSIPNLVRVTTTNGFVLNWRGSDAVGKFLHGERPQVEMIKAYHPDGRPFDEQGDEDLWDPTIQGDVLYAGVMTAPAGEAVARWPEDNWSRRTYAFQKVAGKWIRSEKPLFSKLPSKPTWVGHNYGHHIFQGHVFYERVTEDRDGTPWKTEIFACRLKDPFHCGSEIAILKLPFTPWRNSLRSFGGSLMEGPRVFFANGEYFMSFSAGDYQNDNYGIHLARSTSLLGPYKPVLSRSGLSLRDFSLEIEKVMPMTWGAGRAAYFSVAGKWWALFHGIPKVDTENVERGYRSVFLTPVTFDQNGLPVFLNEASGRSH